MCVFKEMCHREKKKKVEVVLGGFSIFEWIEENRLQQERSKVQVNRAE